MNTSHDTRNVRRQNAARSGVTLIELLLVMAILAVLGTLGLGVMAGAEERALENATRAQLERLGRVLNAKLEDNTYRILPARLEGPQDPSTVQAFRASLLNEIMRVEFPWQQRHFDAGPYAGTFPRNGGLVPLGVDATGDYPQISKRYEAKLNQMFVPPAVPPPNNWWEKQPVDLDGSTVIEADELEVFWRTISSECLYVVLSLNTDQFGDPLVGILRPDQVGDTDLDGVPEVLDAFGDPVRFALLALPADKDVIDQMIIDGDCTDSVRPEYSREFGFEVLLDPVAVPQPNQQIGQIRGPRPASEYRFVIQSIHLSTSPIQQEIIEQY
jgi:prepilin-type N-terminal cleavage/methylation domain-containing protein